MVLEAIEGKISCEGQRAAAADQLTTGQDLFFSEDVPDKGAEKYTKRRVKLSEVA